MNADEVHQEAEEPMPSAAEAGEPRVYLRVATMCERVLTEQDNVASLIRLVDLFTIPSAPGGERLPADVVAGFVARFFVAFVSVDFEGTKQLDLTIRGPGGEEVGRLEHGATFAGDSRIRSVNVTGTIGLPVDREGLYEIEVALDAQVMTHVPFLVRKATAPADAGASGGA